MNYIKIDKCDIANGPGVRCVLWVSGCRVDCPNCHNPQSHAFDAGQPFDEAVYRQIKEILSRPFIDGITISGGNPTDPYNIPPLCELVERLRADFHDTKTIWLYSGYYINAFEGCTPDSSVTRLISNCDVMVDGPYIESERDITLKFRGSRNQRLIDIKKTIEQNKIVLWEEN